MEGTRQMNVPFIIVSNMELLHPTSARHRRDSYARFKSHGTNHSALAQTLPAIIRQAEAERQPYRLMAYPGIGYYIKALPPLDQQPKPERVYLREIDAGAGWVVCSKGDPGAVAFVQEQP
jgi:hypothetical protein